MCELPAWRSAGVFAEVRKALTFRYGRYWARLLSLDVDKIEMKEPL